MRDSKLFYEKSAALCCWDVQKIEIRMKIQHFTQTDTKPKVAKKYAKSSKASKKLHSFIKRLNRFK